MSLNQVSLFCSVKIRFPSFDLDFYIQQTNCWRRRTVLHSVVTDALKPSGPVPVSE